MSQIGGSVNGAVQAWNRCCTGVAAVNCQKPEGGDKCNRKRKSGGQQRCKANAQTQDETKNDLDLNCQFSHRKKIKLDYDVYSNSQRVRM